MHRGPRSIPVHPTSYPTHIPFIPSESTLPFQSYSNFNIIPWKSKVKVVGEVQVWSHNVSLTFYRLTSLSLQVNQPSHSWDMTFSNLTENPRSRKRWTLKVTSWVQQSIDSHPFRSMSISHPIPDFKIWPWKSEVKVTREGNVESHKVGVTSYQLTFLSFHVKWTMTVHNYRPRQFHRTSNGENPSSGDRDMGFTSLAAARSTARPPACPNHDNNTPPAQRAEGYKQVLDRKSYIFTDSTRLREHAGIKFLLRNTWFSAANLALAVFPLINAIGENMPSH